MKKLFYLLLITAALFFLDGCKKYDAPVFEKNHPAEEKKCHGMNATVALEWYKLQLRFLLERNSTLNGTYFGYLGIGLYESVRNGINNATSLSSKLYQMPAMPARENNKSYYWPESANAAMAGMLRSYNTGLTPANLASIDSLENVFNQKFNAEAGAAAFSASQDFGRSIATAIYNWSLTDNFNPSNTGYVPPVFPGAWEPTLPALANGVLPYVSGARPFLSENLTSVAPPFPAAYSENPASYFYKIVKNVYDVSQTLTQEQKDIALFWVDQGNGIGYTPPGHDFSFITQALEQKHANLAIAAEAYAKAGIAERDATIVCFRSKYTYNLLRPITYIRRFIDPNWLPFIVTPPHPEYPAAHAFITGSVMAAVTRVLGYNVPVTDHTYDFRGWAPRTYTTLFNGAKEAGMSRLYGGIHYLPSINIGLLLGHNLGDKIGKMNLCEGGIN
jgi:hypothetical protein